MAKDRQRVLDNMWLKYLCELDNNVIPVLVIMWHSACSEHLPCKWFVGTVVQHCIDATVTKPYEDVLRNMDLLL